MNLRQIVLLFLSISLISFLNSCVGTKTSGTGRPGKYVQVFYTDANATQYFVHPLNYTSDTCVRVNLDFTFRDSVDKPPVRILFSVFSENAVKGHDSCYFGLTIDDMSLAKKLYAEPVKSGFKYRYEIIVSYDVFVEMVRERSAFYVSLEDENIKFLPDKKALKAFPCIERSTIIMLETR